MVGLVPLEARAWTEASVQTARGTVTVSEDGTARVALVLSVRIHRGWLEGLDIVGLDPDLELDEDKPVWASTGEEPGRKFTPEVRLHRRGRLSLSFRGRGASPRRGLLWVGLSYRTRAVDVTPGDDGELEIRWTLPAWQSGLDGVVLAMRVPGSGAQPLEETGAEDTIHTRVVEGEQNTTAIWERPHLPRTVPWTIGVRSPAEHYVAGLHRVSYGRPPKPPASLAPHVAPQSRVAVVAAALWLWFAFIGWTFERAARRVGAVARRLVPLPLFGSLLLQAGLLTGGTFGWESHPSASLVAFALATILALSTTAERIRAPTGRGAWAAPDRETLQRTRVERWRQHLGVGCPGDGTSLLGLLLALVVAVGCLATTWDTGDLLLSASLLFLFMPPLTATRFHLPSTATERLRLLAAVARRTSRVGLALRLEVWREGGKGELAEARLLCVEPGNDEPLEARIAEVRGLGGVRRELQLWSGEARLVARGERAMAFFEGAHRPALETAEEQPRDHWTPSPSASRSATRPETLSGSVA